MKPFYSNPAAKYFFMKMSQARSWRSRFSTGEITPPPRSNPYITRSDWEAYYRALRKRR